LLVLALVAIVAIRGALDRDFSRSILDLLPHNHPRDILKDVLGDPSRTRATIATVLVIFFIRMSLISVNLASESVAPAMGRSKKHLSVSRARPDTIHEVEDVLASILEKNLVSSLYTVLDNRSLDVGYQRSCAVFIAHRSRPTCFRCVLGENKAK